MTLAEYIGTVGDEAAAKLLGISIRAARSYREKRRKPRPEQAARMVKRSRGALTYEAIYK